MLNENPLIDLENIFFNIQQKDLLSNINISLQAGEIVGLIGPNGAGKSTIMKIISGLYKPTSGKIRIKEKPLKGE
ncbi:MAG TPA: ATP-binding cassette domain-containing protein, partial [Tissierellaceae bacterium]